MNKISNLFLTLALASALASALALFSCKEDPPVTPPTPPTTINKDTITLSIDDVTHRSITINIKTTANNPRSRIKLFRTNNANEIKLAEYPITVQDTNITDDYNGQGLQFNQSYTYLAMRFDSLDERKDSSNMLEVKTLDTTTHNYSWQEFIFGEFTSELLDVWGTDENNVYACGGVYIGESSYGILHWNGIEWIPDSTAGGLAIFGFGANDIWCVGGAVFHFDGSKWNQKDAKRVGTHFEPIDTILFNNRPYYAIWGTSSSNLYLGNLWGKIIHWNGTKAKDLGKISDYQISGIWGSSESNIYITTTNYGNVISGELFHYNGISFQILEQGLSNPGPGELLGPFEDIWTYDGNELFIPGNVLNIRRNDKWSYYSTGIFLERVKGSSLNNIFLTGHFGSVNHYNGKNWLIYKNIFNPTVILVGIEVFENTTFLVGYNNYQGFIYIGQKQQ